MEHQVLITIEDFERWEDLIRSWPSSRAHVIVVDQWCSMVAVSCTRHQALVLALAAAGPNLAHI